MIFLKKRPSQRFVIVEKIYIIIYINMKALNYVTSNGIVNSLVQKVKRLTYNRSVSSSSPIQGARCFLEQYLIGLS